MFSGYGEHDCIRLTLYTFHTILILTKMAKEVAGFIKLQIKGGAANPSPPVGPALGSKGINIMGFCKEFNMRLIAGTARSMGITVKGDFPA